MNPINLLLFGDQTVEKLSSIQSLVRYSKSSPAARSFLQQATDVVQLDFSRLSSEEHGWRHEFSSLLGLAEENARQDASNGMIATVLMCIGRLGELLLYAEEDPSILGSQSSPIEILAFCTGLLPAAAAAAARDTSELLKLGIEIVSITFRMSFEISHRMRLVEDVGGDWAATIVGATVERTQSVLDEFHTTQSIPEPRKLAIGVMAKGWLTLVGPPSSLTRLWAWSPELDTAAKISTDTNGPIHSSHMPRIDIEKVLGDSPLLNTPLSSKARITANSAQGTYAHSTLRSLLREMIIDIAHHPLRLSDTLEGVISSLPGKGEVRLTTVGPTGHLPTVQRALQEMGIPYYKNKHQVLETSKARGGSDMIAIVGMAGRFPGSETIDGFWEQLLAGEIHIKKVPKSRFDLDVFYDPTGKKKNSTTAQHGSWLDRPGLFDNRLFNISPREAAQMDPIQRLLLTTSYEALEVAGYSPNASLATNSSRIATYFGQTSDDWHEVLNNEGVDIYYVPSLARAFGPSRLNYHYKWGGGSFAVDTACATSTTAISLACSALIARECDTALAGGGSVLVSPNSFSGLSRSGMISTTGGCRTFHNDADGYARGEGVGVVVLKRLEDAINENDNVLGVIRGSARVYSSSATSITHPDGKAQKRVYDEVLRQTCVIADDVGFVEMHGTGTQAGDAVEMNSILETLGRGRAKDNPLVVGAVKANVGHGEAAAGVTSLIKVLMMLRERKIAPQPGMPFEVNQSFPPLKQLNVHIASKDTTLKLRPNGDGKLKILLNSFDASGGNTSLLIEDAPQRNSKKDDPRSHHCVTLSARTPTSLHENSKRLHDYLARHPETKLADLAYTTSARRMHQDLRKAYTAGSISEIVRLLRADKATETAKDHKRKDKKTHKVFSFTGQGVQCVTMGKALYQHSHTFRAALSNYQEMAENQGLPAFIDLISEGCSDLASQSPVRVHLAIVALEISIAQLLKTWGIRPDLVIGHSLGEYAALCVAGVLSVSDTLHLVGQRAFLLEKKLTPGSFAMIAIRKSNSEVRGILERMNSDSCEIACLNGPNETVVSGVVSDITNLKIRLDAEGTKTMLLKLPYGFHSQQVEPILEEYAEIAKGVVFSTPTIPVASTLTGQIVRHGSTFSPSYLARQAREPVNFIGALRESKTAGFEDERTLWIEVGPEPICSGFIRATLDVAPDRLLPIMKGNEDNWKTLSACLAGTYQSGAFVNWAEYHKEYQESLTLLELPTYAFDEKDFWTPYVEPERAQIADSMKAMEPQAEFFVPGFPSSSLQHVESEHLERKNISVTFASQTLQPDLLRAIQGHVVDGITVCPLGLFCDMALSASSYVISKLKPERPVPRMSVHTIELTHPLIVPEVNPAQLVKVTASLSLESNAVAIRFSSVNGGGMQEHGGCQVRFDESKDWLAQMNQNLFLVKSRIGVLRDQGLSGKAHRLLKPMVYKLFDSLVAYSDSYKALEEVVLDSECRDALGIVKLPNVSALGNFSHSPYWMDSSVHLAGFLLNGSLKYPEDIACLSTGFDSWRTFEDLSIDKSYTSYVCIQETGDQGMIVGDAYVFNGDNLVLATMGIKFQKMKRVVLNSLLGGRGSKVSGTVNVLQAKILPKNFSNAESNSSASVEVVPGPTRGSSSRSSRSDERDMSTPATLVVERNTEVISKFLSAVAAESGYDLGEMTDDTNFNDMGLDSLMSITITAVLQRDFGVELPATFFADNPTIREAKLSLGLETEPESTYTKIVEIKEPIETVVPLKSPVQNLRSPVTTQVIEIDPTLDDDLGSSPKLKLTSVKAASPATPTKTPTPKVVTPAKAIHLQGPHIPTSPSLFLLPDATGSPVTYISLPAVSPSLSIFGLQSPFPECPSQYSVSLPEACAGFLTAVRIQQPHGPYLLGGYSFGGLYAYEVTRQLLEQGEEVSGLLIVDMAMPESCEASNVETMTHLLGKAELIAPLDRQSAAKKELLKCTVGGVLDYECRPLPPGRCPRKTVVVAATSQVRGERIAQAGLRKWLREGESKRGWENWVGEVEWREIDGEHLSLLRYPLVNTLAEILRDAVAEIAKAA